MHSATLQTDIPGNRDRPFLIAIVAFVLVLHAFFLAYDYSTDFASFYRVDRADNRVDAMQHLFQVHDASELAHTIATNNIIIGEYIVQTGLFYIGGPLAVILFQIALQLAAVLAVYRIAKLVLDSPRLSLISALLYAVLPHCIAFTHQYSTEAIGTPLVILAVWLVAEYLIADASWAYLLLAGTICGLAACIRPVLIPLTACLAVAVLARRGPGAIRGAVGMVGIGILPAVLLLTFFYVTTHQVSLGNTLSGMGYNLYLRAMRITQSMPEGERQQAVDHYFAGEMHEECIGDPVPADGTNCAVPLSGFITFTLQYPGASARFILRDVISFVAKSGISSLTTNYLALSANDEMIKDYKSGWHAVWDSQGMYAAIVWVLHASPLAAVLELAGSGLFMLLFTGYLFGCFKVWRSAPDMPRPRLIMLIVLALLPLYMFATSEVSAYMLSRYRAPSEFAICILATSGGAVLMRHRRKRRQDAVRS